MTKMICILLLLFPMNAQAQEVVLAVSYFDNHAKDVKYEALRKGLAEMLISDLSTSKDLKVVERERLNDVLNEISLQQSKFFDQKTAQKLGQGIGAGYILVGSYTIINSTITIQSRIIDVASAEIALAVKVGGKTSEWLQLQQQLATELLEGLSGTLSLVQRKQIGQSGTNDFDALLSYGSGLDSLDKGNSEQALAQMESAVKQDGNFQLAVAQKERLQELLNAFDLSQQSAHIEVYKRHIKGLTCEDSVEYDGDFDALSYGEKLTSMWLPNPGGSMPHSGAEVQLLEIPASMLQLGLFEEAEKVLKELSRGEHLDSESLLCTSYQMLSYSKYLQGEFDTALEWQIKSLDLPQNDLVLPCMGGEWSRRYNLPGINGPLKTEIENAMANPEKIKQIAHRLRLLNKLGSEVRAQGIEDSYTCEDALNWMCENHNSQSWCQAYRLSPDDLEAGEELAIVIRDSNGYCTAKQLNDDSPFARKYLAKDPEELLSKISALLSKYPNHTLATTQLKETKACIETGTR